MFTSASAVLLLACSSNAFAGQLLSSSAGRSHRTTTLPCSRQRRSIRARLDDNSDDHDHDHDHDKGLLGLPPDLVGPLLPLLAAQLVLFIGVGAVIPTIALYGKAIGLSSATNGLVLSAPAVALLLFAQPAGRFADKARKPAMLLGMGAIAISDLGTALSTSLAPLLLARFGLGAGRAVSESGERGMLADLAGRAPEVRGRALAAQQAVTAVGIALGAPLGGVVVEAYGPRAAFLCVTAAATVVSGLYALLPETLAAAAATTPAPPPQQQQQPQEQPQEQQRALWPRLLEERRWQGICIAEAGARFGFSAKIASVPVLAAAALSGGAASAGLLLSAAGLSGLVGAPVGGFITDRAGAKTTAVTCGLFSGVALLLAPFALSSSSSSAASSASGSASPLSPLLGGALDSLRGTLGGGGGGAAVLGQEDAAAVAFVALILAWSAGAAAQGPAFTALAQEAAPAGVEAEALALPKAAGDATSIFAPFLLGAVADQHFAGLTGFELAVAGVATLLSSAALALLLPASTEVD